MRKVELFLLASLGCAPLFAQESTAPASTTAPASATAAAKAAPTVGREKIAPGSKVYLEPMDGFDTYLSAAILKKKVPLAVVDDKSQADYVITGSSHVDKAGWAKTIFVSPRDHAEASIAIKDAKTGVLVFAYNVDKANSAKGNQSTAEACAKHMREAIEKEEKK